MHPIIKICGITTEGCVEACLQAGVRTIGLNFYPPSPRAVTIERAKELRQLLPAPVQVIGVFVRPTVAEVAHAVEAVGLTAVQLHGTSEPYWHDFIPPPVPLWLASGIGSLADIAQLKLQIKLCRAMNITVNAVLVDAKVAGQEGGTGVQVPWSLLQETTWEVPLILAGGLKPGTISQAIQQVRPSGVDVASGVESSPGIKDAVLVKQLVQQAKSAYQACGTQGRN